MKRNTKTTRITAHLTENPSYFKWSIERLCTKYDVSLPTMRRILTDLDKNKMNYLKSLK